MIKYDYLLERDEGLNKRVKYMPDRIPKNIDSNIILLEGPNSSGKSTLLNIIALGCWGLKKKGMQESLHSKIDRLLSSDYQNIKFSLELVNTNSSSHLSCKKNDLNKSDIIVEHVVKGKKQPLSSEIFHKEYDLIYDIPENPFQRLKELTKDIKDKQNILNNSLSSLKVYLTGILRDIENSPDPEKITKKENEINRISEDMGKIQSEISSIEELKDNLEILSDLKILSQYNREVNAGKEKLGKLKKTNRETIKIDSIIKKEVEEIESNIRAGVKKLIELQRKIANGMVDQFKKEKDRIEVWQSFSIRDDIMSENIMPFDYAVTFSNIVEAEKDKYSNLNEIKLIQIYKELITVLEKYDDLNIEIPAFKKKISEIIEDLVGEYSHLESIDMIYKAIISLYDDIDEFKEYYYTIIKEYVPRFNNLCEEYGYKDKEVETITNKISSEIERITKEIKQKEQLIISILVKDRMKEVNEDNIDIHLAQYTMNVMVKEYSLYDHIRIQQIIEELKDKKKARENELFSLRTKGNILADEVKKLKKREIHCYYNYKEKLLSLHNTIQGIESSLEHEYLIWIDKLINNKVPAKGKIPKKEKQYYDSISDYFAELIGKIKHIDDVYTIKSIDLQNGIIKTTTNKILRVDDFGTGQSQSAYLVGLLNGVERKAIVLLDEISNMDSDSLQPVINRLNELNQEKKLVTAILVQRADEIELKELDNAQ